MLGRFMDKTSRACKIAARYLALHFTLCIGSLVSCLPVRVLICAPTWKSTCCSFQRENLQSSVFFMSNCVILTWEGKEKKIAMGRWRSMLW